MGSGIAQCFAAAGSTVVVVESDQETAAAALDRIRTGLGHAAERGLLVGATTRPISSASTSWVSLECEADQPVIH